MRCALSITAVRLYLLIAHAGTMCGWMLQAPGILNSYSARQASCFGWLASDAQLLAVSHVIVDEVSAALPPSDLSCLATIPT